MNSKWLLVRRVLLPVVLCLSVVLVVVGCGSDDTGTTGGPETTAAVANSDTTAGPTSTESATTAESTSPTEAASAFDGEIIIGAINSMTGANAMTAAERRWAEEAAVADINADGGVDLGGKKMELKIRFIDDKTEPTEAAAAMEKLIKVEGIDVILGSNVLNLNLAAATVAEKYQAYYHLDTCWTSAIREQDYATVSDIFLEPAGAAEVPFNAMDLQPEAERPTRCATFMQDNIDGQGLAEGVKAMAEKHGYSVVMEEYFTPGTKDYSSAILKLKQNDIDALFVFTSPADGITFVKQVREQNYSPKFIFGWMGFWATEFMEALGPDSDYIGYDGFWFEGLPNPGCAELSQRFKNDHDGLDSVSIGLPYAAVQTLAMAMERAGSADALAVRDEIFGGTFEGTAMGDLTYDEDGIATTEMLALGWKDGKRVVWYPAVEGAGEFEWFVPWDER